MEQDWECFLMQGSQQNERKYYFAGANRIAMRENGTLTWLLSDHLGSTSVTANASGSLASSLRYTAFGEVRATSGTTSTDYRYTGQREESELGLYYYVARFYDPSIMQFNQPDSLIPDPYNPLDWDRYAYSRNNPIRYNDPTGHWVETAFDIAFIAYDIYDIKANGLTWVSGLSLVVDVAGAVLPVVTGAGLAVRALTHADDLANVVKATDKVIDAV
ncbi:MAG: RHS repeat-associated core domain-containing protein [Bellilinea sp.]